MRVGLKTLILGAVILNNLGVLAAVAVEVKADTHARGSGASEKPSGKAAEKAAPLEDPETAKAKLDLEPGDYKLRYNYAEALRRAGKTKEAAREFLAVTESEPTFYHAYHQLSISTSDKHLIDEALSRLVYLKEERPKDLLLRVALSELYEKKQEYFQASKVLVDLVYQNAVPDKYLAKVNNRIRFLQSKTKDSLALDKAYVGDEQMETSPPPLPEATLNRDLSISKVKEPRVMQGFGHATLLP